MGCAVSRGRRPRCGGGPSSRGPDRAGDFGRRRRNGGRGRQREESRLDRHDQRRHRQPGALQLSLVEARLRDYVLRIRATGYELEAPVSVDVVLALVREVDLKLRKVRDVTPQLTNAEWIASFPGSPEQKKFLYGCVGCHTLERVAKSKHDAAGFQAVMKRMAGDPNNSHVDRPP